MPSRYEPCGLSQMYSFRYGTVPVVRATGGLDDTVRDLSEPEGDGFKFAPFTPEALLEAVDRGLALYRRPAELDQVRRRGMARRFGWDRSARAYGELYERLVRQGRARGRKAL